MHGTGPLAALYAYKQRRKLRLQPTRGMHRSINEFQRINGYKLSAYRDFVDSFFVRPRTGDMQQMVDDVLERLWP